ncbi:hypothetical protein JYU34_010246, partial [Plutella xylostella]
MKLNRTPPPATIGSSTSKSPNAPPRVADGTTMDTATVTNRNDDAAIPVTKKDNPTIPIKRTQEVSKIKHCNSSPNLNELGTQSDLNIKTVRACKRKHNDTDDANEWRDFMKTMQSMFSSLSTDMDLRLNALHESLKVITNQNTEITKSIEFMSNQHDELLKRIEALELEKREDKKALQLLEDKLEFYERKSRSTCIEIRNIPDLQVDKAYKRNESKNELCEVVKSLSSSLNIKIEKSDVNDIYRTSAKKDSMRPIVVDFCSAIKKEDVIKAVKDFNKNKSNSDKLNTLHLNLKGPKKSVFISETLTAKTQRLFYVTREFAKEYSYNYCWTSNGLIYLRKAENMPYIRVMSESDIEKLK